jgi:Flp pilus assembly protein TadD
MPGKLTVTTLLVLMHVIPLAGVSRTPQESPVKPSASARGAEPHLGKGYDDLRNERFEDAVREFRAALALDPTLVMRARFPLAIALYQLRRLDEARKEFEAIRSQVGNDPNVLYFLGRVDFDRGNIDAAIETLSKAAAKPPFPDTAFYLGSAYLRKRDFPLAEKWLQEAARLAPRDYHVQERLGHLYQQEGRKAEADKAADLAAELRRRDTEASQQRIDCAQKLETSSLEDARTVCARLFDPNDAEKLTMLGTLYGQRGDYQDALDPLRRAADLNPNSPQMLYNLALNYVRLHRYEEARAPLVKAVERWPDLFPLNSLLGAVLFQLGEERPAYEALHHANELNSSDPGTANYLYGIALRLGKESQAGKQYDASIGYLNEAAKLRPQEPEPHRLLAEIYDAAGRPAKAAEERRQLERLTSPGNVKPD